MTFDGTEPMRILAIGAHPDDIEAGCGGALVKYAQNGHRAETLRPAPPPPATAACPSD